MIVDEDGKFRAVLSARLVRLADAHIQSGATDPLDAAVDAELVRVESRIVPEDIERYRRLAAIFREIGLAGQAASANPDEGAGDRLRALRKERDETERYFGFTAAAEALHRTSDLDDFLRLLPQFVSGRTYGSSGGPISRFALMWALTARNQALQRVQAMLSAGARLDLTTQPHGLTILHEMAMVRRKGWDKRLSILRLLLMKGAQLEARYRHGRTPLLCAIAEGSIDDVRLFLEAGSDV